MFILKDKVELLCPKYREEYGTELIGEALGKFKSDYKKDLENVVCTRDLFALIKVYYNELKETDKITGIEKAIDTIKAKGYGDKKHFS